jgi:hypothetical protein
MTTTTDDRTRTKGGGEKQNRAGRHVHLLRQEQIYPVRQPRPLARSQTGQEIRFGGPQDEAGPLSRQSDGEVLLVGRHLVPALLDISFGGTVVGRESSPQTEEVVLELLGRGLPVGDDGCVVVTPPASGSGGRSGGTLLGQVQQPVGQHRERELPAFAQDDPERPQSGEARLEESGGSLLLPMAPSAFFVSQLEAPPTHLLLRLVTQPGEVNPAAQQLHRRCVLLSRLPFGILLWQPV